MALCAATANWMLAGQTQYLAANISQIDGCRIVCSIHLNAPSKDAAGANAHTSSPLFTVLKTGYKIYPEYFKNIFQPGKDFNVIAKLVYIKGIAPCNKRPVQSFKQRNFVGEQSIEMMLCMPVGKRRGDITVAIKRGQLETVYIFTGGEGTIAIKMLKVLDKNFAAV